MHQTELPAFVLIKLPLNDGNAERSALRNAGLNTFIKGRTNCNVGRNVYCVDADEMYNVDKRDSILDMLAVLGVQSILHVSGKREVTRCTKDNNYLPIGLAVAGNWNETKRPFSDGYHIKGRNFVVA
ncbi:MAG: hypothetical protein [Bacteriophage sp.]|nr:MAG: hypothetical protein [Bacteriophage sp.]